MFQTTLKSAVECTGVGIHSGAPVNMTLKPARAGTGIQFRRMDVKGRAAYVPARFDLVSSTRLGTTLTNQSGVSVHTVEHLMAAFAGLGVDNAVVEIDGPELPIMDGSSSAFVFLIDCAGLETQDSARLMLRVKKRVAVGDGVKLAELLPADDFSLEVGIEFASAAIAKQRYLFSMSSEGFKRDIARARTFGFKHEVDMLRANGLARGGSLDNSIVIDGDAILNEGGLRFGDEFARHKLLDAIGDLALAGAPLMAHFRGVRCGHELNNQLLRELFADATAYEFVSFDPALAFIARPPMSATMQVPVAAD